ncbi:MAG TPA: hypothetical protein P5052_00845 [Candidatus Paceibacterota bacterium]|nr:hypothetical protein [Candidatus Paceibacterota bacterium]
MAIPIIINFPDFPSGISYCEAAKLLVPVLQDYMLNTDFILFRCPAFNFNVLGITQLTEELAENFSSKIAIQHGSEIGFWLAYELTQIYKIPAVFSRGIPTSRLPDYATITGHPNIKKTCMSHWEAVEGVAHHVATKEKPVSEVEFILIMLGSGTGIYLWEKPGAISAFKIRQWEGPMSPSSIGGLDTLALLDFMLSQGETSLKEARKKISALVGSKGGFQLFDPRWLDLREFRKDVENFHPLATSLFEAWIIQISGKVGEVKLSMKQPKQPTPVYFYGGGSNWPELVSRISDRLSEHLFLNPEVITIDPENEFFISQAIEFSKSL